MTNDIAYDIIAMGGELVAGVKKIIEKMKNQPSGIRFEEAEKVLNYYGYYQVRAKGSHRQFRNADGDLTTVQYDNPIGKSIYQGHII